MALREGLTAVVLGDAAPEAALGSALEARVFAERVIIAERDADTARRLAQDALPEDVAVEVCDWNDGEQAARLLQQVDTPWTLFLGAGEGVDTVDRAALEREWSRLAPGPVEVRVGERRETRLHPPVASALAAVGGPAEVALSHLRVRPLAESGATVPTNIASAPNPDAVDVAFAAELPASLRSPARLRGALRGDDLDALERLGAVLDQHEERRLLDMARAGRDVCWTDEGEAEPLVTLRIATYHRPQHIGAAIESCLAQTYERVEVLVVGDRCSDETARVVRGFHDPRLRFVNLPSRGMYPDDPMARWRVAGVWPANAALMLGEGSWITACDDDDRFTPDHVEVLLREARARRLEMVWSKADMEVAPGQWQVIGADPLAEGQVTQGSVLYSMGLRFLRMSNTCWRRQQPADWNLWSRMQAIGVRTGFVDRVTYTHHLETHQRERR
ncbi:MAG: hypothetical protein RL760_281 [Candidatus Eisenbacteria bacterium]